jgi:hypothetical protein
MAEEAVTTSFLAVFRDADGWRVIRDSSHNKHRLRADDLFCGGRSSGGSGGKKDGTDKLWAIDIANSLA